MNATYEKLPLIDLTAPRAVSHRNRISEISTESGVPDTEDAVAILKQAGFSGHIENILDPWEKYLIETQPTDKKSLPIKTTNSGMKQKDMRRPHYTRLLVSGKKLIFQAACCLPLKVVAASFDGNPASGRVLFSSHSEGHGGKLVYGFQGTGTEIIIDLKRGESTKAQRLIFTNTKSKSISGTATESN